MAACVGEDASTSVAERSAAGSSFDLSVAATDGGSQRDAIELSSDEDDVSPSRELLAASILKDEDLARRLQAEEYGHFSMAPPAPAGGA